MASRRSPDYRWLHDSYLQRQHDGLSVRTCADSHDRSIERCGNGKFVERIFGLGYAREYC